MNKILPNQSPTQKLLQSGAAPPLLTTRIIPAGASANNEIETVIRRPARSPTVPVAAASSGDSPARVPTVKLLGTIKGGMPATPPPATPDECLDCRKARRPADGETLCPPCHLKGRFAELTGGGKLAPSAWQNIRRTLCLPTDIESLSAKQARAMILLLDSFVNCYSFNDQLTMTRQAVVAALLVLPAFPPSFIKPLKTAATLAGLDNPKRKPISVNKFAAVAARQGSFCFWCGIRVVREAEIPQTNRLARNHSTVVYLSKDGGLREETLGTIDHLVRVTDGGDNSLANLVISCHSCNQKRDRITLAYNRPFAKQRVSCERCGGKFFHPGWGCCSICGTVPEPARKRANGEDRIGKLFALIGRAKKRVLRKLGLSK